MSGQTGLLRDVHVKVSPSNRLQVSVTPIISSKTSSRENKPNFLASVSGYMNSQFLSVLENADGSRVFVATPANSSKKITISSVGLTSPLASHSNYNGQGALPPLPRAKTFTRRARLRVLDAAGALEKEGYKPSDFWFFTGTLPGGN